MAASSGKPEPSLKELEALAGRVRDCDFFQAVRLLQRLQPGRELIGRHGEPSAEAVRFSVRPTLNFPTQEIHSLDLDPDRPAAMTVNFFGMSGHVGVLPTHYTEYMIERIVARDTTLRAFLDLFHHRLLSLFYRAWEKYRFGVPYERQAPVPFTRYLLSIAGLGSPGLANRQEVPDEAFAFYSGLLSQRPRSAAGLELILSDHFGVDAQVRPLAGGWRPLDRGSWSVLSDFDRESEQLGVGAVLGDEIWDPQSAITIRIGPLTRARYEDFLPGGKSYGPLRAFARFYCGQDLDVEVQLLLRRDDAPPLALEAEDVEEVRLGWTSWLHTKLPVRDPDDAILRLWLD